MVEAGAQSRSVPQIHDQVTLNTGAVYVDPNLQITSLTLIMASWVTISSGFQSGDVTHGTTSMG